MNFLLLLLSLWTSFSFSAEKKFTFRLSGEPETLDWNLAHTSVETHLMMNIMDGLVAIDEKLKVIPMLATKWKISPDRKTYTFDIRKGVHWSDGVELNAQHFVDGWKRLLTRSTAASYAYFLYDIVGAEAYHQGKETDFSKVGVKAKNDYVLEVKLSHAVPYWIYIPTFWVTFPVRQDLIEKHGKQWTAAGKLVTCGPWILEKYEIDNRLVFKNNPKYWNKKSNVDQWVGLIVKDENTAASLYESAQLDFANDLPTLALRRYQANPELKEFPYLKILYLGFATNRKEVSNPALRRAISMAIDKSQIGKILFGRQKAASSFVPPPLFSSGEGIGLPYDPARAKAEFKKAGSPTTPLELLVPNWEKNLTLAQYLQSELKKTLGLDVQIQTFDFKTYRKQMESQSHSMFMASWGADYPDPDNFLSIFTSKSGNNRTKYANAKYDELVSKGRNLSKQVQREKVYRDAQKILLQEDVPAFGLYYEPNLILIKNRVKGLIMDPMNNLNLRKITLE